MAMGSVTDFTVNGQCSGCGACCSDFLPMTQREIRRLRDFVRKNHYKAHTHVLAPMRDTIDATCPFRNDAEEKCDVYSIRPEICRRFLCNHTAADIERDKDECTKMGIPVSVRSVVFGDDSNAAYVRQLNRAMFELMLSGKI